MSPSSVEDAVDQAITSLLKGDFVEQQFGFLLQHVPVTLERKYAQMKSTLEELWKSFPLDMHESAMKVYIQRMLKIQNSSRAQILLNLLQHLVDHSYISAKLVCNSIVQHDELTYKIGHTWCHCFTLIRSIIGGVDYKGVRDLLRFLLEKSNSIPIIDNINAQVQLQSVTKVIEYILDRNACLLPSLFAVHEISKVHNEQTNWNDKKLGRLLSEFIASFKPTAQMVSVIGRSKLLPIVGHSSSTSNVWRLNTNDLKFSLSGPLPYRKELLEPQKGLLRYVLEQQYSRDMVCHMLALNKQLKERCRVLEDQLVDLVIHAMESSESEDTDVYENGSSQSLWQHLSSQLIYFVLFQFASFPKMVLSLYMKLKDRDLKKGRNHLMWVLLQFISGSIQKNPLNEFLPVLKLYDLLYDENEVVPVPDINKPLSTHDMAITCIWIHLNKKAQTDRIPLKRPIPNTLKEHMEFLNQSVGVGKTLTLNDYRIALLCNAHSTNTDYFTLPMSVLMDNIYGNDKRVTILPGNVQASSPYQPLPMCMLDSLTIHTKMSLIHNIVTKVIRLASTKSPVALAPGLIETYSRLLVYMEIESLGIKGFISQLLPIVYRSQAWGILHTLLEMFSYRIHHIQPHYRVQLLTNLHSLTSMPQTNQNQLHICVESTVLRLITGLSSSEVQPQLSRVLNEPKAFTFISQESEELNRVLILTLARSMHVTGAECFSPAWCHEILSFIMQHTPHGWSYHTLTCFPATLADFFQKTSTPKEDKVQLKMTVDAEYKKWKSLANETDIIAYFSMQGRPTLFLCILWKNLLEEKRIPNIAYKVLDRLGPRVLSQHLRTFADFIVPEFASAPAGPPVNRYLEVLNDMVWKYNIFTIDRLVLCLGLRNLEGNDSQVCMFIIQLILLKPQEFRMRVNDFVSENSPEHWKQSNWHEKHMAFHTKYPEKFFFESVHDLNNPMQHQYLPVYFGSVCLRFIPVLDIIIHRFLEQPLVTKNLEGILDHLGGLYKFHDRPVMYLYNTLHYYEKKLVAKQLPLKKKLVQAIIGALKDIRPPNWCLSEAYLSYLENKGEDVMWQPQSSYYISLVGRLVNTLCGKQPPPFPNCDWRFNEFPNSGAHALYATCVELMALPVPSLSVGQCIISIILHHSTQLPRDEFMSWINAVGLILTSLPDSFWQVVYDIIIEELGNPILTVTPSDQVNLFQVLDFNTSHLMFAETSVTYLLAVFHAICHHASIGQLMLLPQFLRERVKPIVKTEEQYLFLCHLVGPFLQRFHTEKTKSLLELTQELYEILERVDRHCDVIQHTETIADFLYHVKYMYVGDGIKEQCEKVIRNLKSRLQLRLRFISHTNVEESGLG